MYGKEGIAVIQVKTYCSIGQRGLGNREETVNLRSPWRHYFQTYERRCEIELNIEVWSLERSELRQNM